jgi:dihydroorotate dehydrogenase
MVSYSLIKEYLFRLDPENAHLVTEMALRATNPFTFLQNWAIEKYFVSDERITQNIFGKQFLNPVGVAAGFDKNAKIIKQTSMLGFGFTEIGAVTVKAQDGNPKPRVFRYPEHESVQNAMGFNNEGMEKISARLSQEYPFVLPIGVNVGKNKLTAEKLAINDYSALIEKFNDICDFMTINISSPNTKGLRDLQNSAFIAELFGMVKEKAKKPVLLKLSPDMEKRDAVDLAISAVENGASGIIATNTTTDYSLLVGAKEFGGLSGRVLKEKSFEMFKAISRELFGKTTLISVGGIDSADEAYARLKAGASLIQIYTAMIFQGPELIKQINEGILERMNDEGFTHISEMIGSDRGL